MIENAHKRRGGRGTD